LKDLEYDNFRLEKRLSETLSRQWRIETLFNTYVFN
jgi:parallel beta-helix repeat protein